MNRPSRARARRIRRPRPAEPASRRNEDESLSKTLLREAYLVAFVDFMGQALSSLVEIQLPHVYMRGEMATIGTGNSFRATAFPTATSPSAASTKFDNHVVKVIRGVIDVQDWTRRLRAILSEIRVLTARPVRGHPLIVQLRQLVWKDAPETHGFLYPGLLVERASFGNLYSFQQPNLFSLSFRTKARLCHDVAEGLAFLHGCGIIHGDVKPENILLFPRGEEDSTIPLAKLSDFSHSLFLCDQEGGQLAWHGFTRPWAAPETVRETHQISHLVAQSDMFSFGLLVAFVMVERPDSFLEVFGPLQPTDDEPFLAHAVEMVEHDRKDLDVELLANVFEMCLPVDPSKRVAHMEDIALALKDEWSAGFPRIPPKMVTWSLENMSEVFNVNEACIAQSIYPPAVSRQLFEGLLCKLRVIGTSSPTQSHEVAIQLGVSHFNGFGTSTDGKSHKQGIKNIVTVANDSIRAAAIVTQLSQACLSLFEDQYQESLNLRMYNEHCLLGCKTRSLIALRSCYETDIEERAINEFREGLAIYGEPKFLNVVEINLFRFTNGRFGPNMPDKNGVPMLLHAMCMAHLHTTLDILRSGANVVQQAPNGCSPLHYLAAFRGEELAAVCDAIRDNSKGVNVDVVTTQYESQPYHFYVSLARGTPLHWAVNRQNLGAAKFLLEMGGSPVLPDSRGCSPLHYALSLNLSDFVDLFTARDQPWSTAAREDMILNAQGYADVVLSAQDFQRLLVNGAGYVHERARTVELLRASVAPVDIEPRLLFCAADRGEVTVAAELLEAAEGGNRIVDALSDYGPPTTGLLRSILHADRVMFDLLMAHGPDVNIRFSQNQTTYLHSLSALLLPDDEVGYFALKLIEAGADVDAEDVNGVKPLWMSLCHGMIPLSEMLLEHGASWDGSPSSPLIHLVRTAQPRCLEGLHYYLGHRPRPESATTALADPGQGRTVLHLAAAMPDMDTAMLLSLLADDSYGSIDFLQRRDSQGRSALHMAAIHANYTAARLLLEAGADADAVDDQEESPLTLALARNDSVERSDLMNSFAGNGASRTALENFDAGTERIVRLLREYGTSELKTGTAALSVS